MVFDLSKQQTLKKLMLNSPEFTENDKNMLKSAQKHTKSSAQASASNR